VIGKHVLYGYELSRMFCELGLLLCCGIYACVVVGGFYKCVPLFPLINESSFYTSFDCKRNCV
jgi:hypothetical protein